MTTIDLHPEEMLDAAQRGTLSARGEADLHAHLGRCAACRLTLSLPHDLRAEAAPTPADAELVALMVRGAMAGEPRAAYAGRARRAGRRVAVAAALLLVGAGAGTAVWASRDTLARRILPEIVELVHARVAAVPAAPPSPRASVARPPAPVFEELPGLAPAPEAVAPAALAPAEAPRGHVRRLARAADAEMSAEGLFADANRARREGDDAGALRGYAELRRAYPGTRQEVTARVVVGQLRLGHGEARDALASFDSYLAAGSDGALAEEARVGRALALMSLGRRDEEREAWTTLLRLYPDSVQGPRARGRLAQLR